MIKPKKLSFPRSEDYWRRAQKYIPNGSMTISMGPISYITKVSPKYNWKGKGCHVWDVDGNKFLDLAPGGYLKLLGYNYKPLTKTIIKQVKEGSIFQMPHALEVEAAEAVIDAIPCGEMVKFARNGADVLTMGVRAARAHTGRDMVLSQGYHGIHDWFIGTTELNKGVPKKVTDMTKTFEYNELETVKKTFEKYPDKIATVVLEPMQLTTPKDNYLHKLKKITHDNGAILIFDEIISGFRFALGGAGEYFGVKPDLACFGKAMSNGYSCSALTGKAEIMDEFNKGAFFSTTYGGETIGLAATKKTIEIMKEKKVQRHNWKVGTLLKKGVDKIIKDKGLEEHYSCDGLPVWTVIQPKEDKTGTVNEKNGILQQEAMQRGMLAGLFHGPSFAHQKEDIRKGLEIYNESFKKVKRYIDSGNVEKHMLGSFGGKVFRKVG